MTDPTREQEDQGTPRTDALDEEATKKEFEFNEDNFDRAIELARQLERDLNASRSAPQVPKIFLDMLAVLHCDGGHYTAEHGLEQSAMDALKEVYRLKQVELGRIAGLEEAAAVLGPYIDSYKSMVKQGDCRVSCSSVAYDIEVNMRDYIVALASAQPRQARWENCPMMRCRDQRMCQLPHKLGSATNKVLLDTPIGHRAKELGAFDQISQPRAERRKEQRRGKQLPASKIAGRVTTRGADRRQPRAKEPE